MAGSGRAAAGRGQRGRPRRAVPAAVVVGVVVAAVVAAIVAAIAGGLLSGGAGRPSAAAADEHLTTVAAVLGRPFYLFRSTVLDHHYGDLALVPAADPGGPRALTTMACARVAFAGGRGVCVTRGAGLFGGTEAVVFDRRLHPLATVAIEGFPNRAQVSPDGRYAAVTDFVNGTSYAAATFSTRTYVIDLRSDRILFDLGKLSVTRNGVAFDDADLDFWGVTFRSDDRHFYATLGDGGSTYLIEGDIQTMTAQVLASGVECPSLSPDQTRIAFKERVPGPTVTWRLSVLDLSTLKRYPLAETRNVDDQAYWLNDSTVAYGLESGAGAGGVGGGGGGAGGMSDLTAGGSIPTDMWEVPAGGGGHPRRLIAGAWSAELVGAPAG